MLLGHGLGTLGNETKHLDGALKMAPFTASLQWHSGICLGAGVFGFLINPPIPAALLYPRLEHHCQIMLTPHYSVCMVSSIRFRILNRSHAVQIPSFNEVNEMGLWLLGNGGLVLMIVSSYYQLVLFKRVCKHL